jgi:hypothetical protein
LCFVACHMRRRIHACHMSCDELCFVAPMLAHHVACHMRRRIHALMHARAQLLHPCMHAVCRHAQAQDKVCVADTDIHRARNTHVQRESKRESARARERERERDVENYTRTLAHVQTQTQTNTPQFKQRAAEATSTPVLTAASSSSSSCCRSSLSRTARFTSISCPHVCMSV